MSNNAMAPAIDLSIVLPTYGHAAAALASSERIGSALTTYPGRWELIVVNDGGTDLRPGDWAGSPARLIDLPRNRGKGAAVREGTRAAAGAVIVFTDADLPYGVDSMLAMARIVRQEKAHVVIGDRTLPGSGYHEDLSTPRRIASRVFTLLVSRVVLGGFGDTQCGLKAMRCEVAQVWSRRSKIDGFAFDVELLYLAMINRLTIRRVPVRLERNLHSSLRLGRDASRMLVDLVRLKRYRSRGLYDSPRLARLVDDEFHREVAGARAELRAAATRSSA